MVRELLRISKKKEGDRQRSDSAMTKPTASEGRTNRDFLHSQPFVLIRACTPFDGIYQTRPDALHEFCLRQRVFFLLGLNRSHDLTKKTLVVNPQKESFSR